MKEIVPSYYKKFRCIAGRCRHSCCIGWEIDIDEDTLILYDDPVSPLYERFRKHIDRTDIPHFRLDGEERCPFLNREGLCDIILSMGEESLCQICDDHPRFRNFFSDRTETGLGLCCEAAAALILFQTDPVTWLAEETAEEALPLTEEETAFLALRERMYSILQCRNVPLQKRLHAMLTMCGSRLPEKTFAQWAQIFRQLERLDPAWDRMLDRLAEDEQVLTLSAPLQWSLPLENLAVYFVFRHMAGTLDDGRMSSRAAFCVLSILFIHELWLQQGNLSGEILTETVRLYSSEIEYSEDNLEALWDILEES